MTETVHVGLSDTYPITIGDNAWSGLVPHLEKNPFTSSITIIDERVNTLHGEKFFRLTDKIDKPAFRYNLPEGENSK